MKKRVTLYLTIFLLIFSSISIFSQAPVITKQPHSQGVIVGQTATFTVEASGDTLTYQWYLNDNPIGGATDSIYTTPVTTLAHNGEQFYVIVSNTHGKDTSNIAPLYVTANGSRVTGGQIALYMFNEGGGTTINDVSGFGSPLNLTINKPSAVSWSSTGLLVKDTALISSSNYAAKIIDTVTANNEITIEIWFKPLKLVNNQANRIIDLTAGSSETDFGVETFPPDGYNFVVRTTSTNSNGIPGTVDSTGIDMNLTHLVCTFSNGVSKIYKNGTQVASKNIGGNFSTWNKNATLALSNIIGGRKPYKGVYYLAAVYERALDSLEVVHNYSMGTSIEHIPFITEDPKDASEVAGYPATFMVQAIGDATLTYQWQKNGTDISGANSSTYTTPVATMADSGSTFRVIVSNTSGKDTSASAVLNVKEASPDCPDGITHYYHLSESSSPYKDTIGYSDGVNTTAAPASITGIVGKAVNFFNHEKIDITADNSFDWKSDESFSIEFWMRTSNVPVANRVIIGRVDASSSLGWWVGITPNGKAAFQLNSSGGTGAAIGDKGLSINDGTWHLIVATRNGSNNMNYLYVDSSKIDSTSQSYLTGFDGTTPITLGYLNVSPFYYYDGSLDEVALYSVALSKSDIQTHYKKGMKGLGYCEAFPTIKAPSGLKAIKDNVDTTNVKLSWTDNSSNELGFVLQRKLGDSASVAAYSIIDTLASDVTSYIDTTASDTTKYTYRIYAYNNDTVSAYSNIATITTPLPVELTSFTVNTVDSKVLIAWATATEINNAGFSIERSADNKKFSAVTFIKGQGTSTEKSYYSYTDKSVLSGKYYYRLKQVDFDGTSQYLKSVEIDLGIPKNYSLEQNYPNPFNPSTTIRFALPMNAKVNIKLYNTLGQEVANIFNSDLSAGIHETTFNASNLSSGVYFYRLEARGTDGSNFVSTKRMLLMK